MFPGSAIGEVFHVDSFAKGHQICEVLARAQDSQELSATKYEIDTYGIYPSDVWDTAQLYFEIQCIYIFIIDTYVGH